MQGHNYSHICNLWGKFLPVGVICTTTDTISIPVGAMYLHTGMFCTLFICLLFPWVQCQSLKPVLSQCSQTGFVTVDDLIAPYTCSYIFYCHGCNKFLHARTFFTLAEMTFIPMGVMYLHARNFCTRSYVFDSYGCNKFLHARTGSINSVKRGVAVCVKYIT